MPDSPRVHPAFRTGLVVLCLLTFAARFLTLSADYPAGIDWSEDLYTDEGWYAGGAINQTLSGSWYAPGDLNTAINFPVLQIIETGYFRLFGMSLASDRSITVLFTAFLILLSYLITRKMAGEIPALICAGLLSVNFFLFASSKQAILDIPMLTLVLLGIWWVVRTPKTSLWQAAVLALIFSLALLTKASALFGLPVLLLLIWQKPESIGTKMKTSLAFLTGIGLFYGGYTLLALHSYSLDYLAYNEVSISPRFTWSMAYIVYTTGRTLWNGMVIDPLGYSLTLVLAPIGLFLFQRYRTNRLVQACILWLVTQSVILITRGYLPPRYYLSFVVPVTMLFSILAVMGIQDLQPILSGRFSIFDKIAAQLVKIAPRYRWLFPILLVAAVGLVNLVRTAGYLAAPKFTYIDMVHDVQQRIQATGDPDPVLLGAIAQTMSIELHIPTVNIQYGTRDLLWKLDHYQPDFYVALGSEGKARSQIEQRYDLNLLATYDVLGNYYAGKPVYLYRLVPKQ